MHLGHFWSKIAKTTCIQFLSENPIQLRQLHTRASNCVVRKMVQSSQERDLAGREFFSHGALGPPNSTIPIFNFQPHAIPTATPTATLTATPTATPTLTRLSPTFAQALAKALPKEENYHV